MGCDLSDDTQTAQFIKGHGLEKELVYHVSLESAYPVIENQL